MPGTPLALDIAGTANGIPFSATGRGAVGNEGVEFELVVPRAPLTWDPVLAVQVVADVVARGREGPPPVLLVGSYVLRDEDGRDMGSTRTAAVVERSDESIVLRVDIEARAAFEPLERVMRVGTAGLASAWTFTTGRGHTYRSAGIVDGVGGEAERVGKSVAIEELEIRRGTERTAAEESAAIVVRWRPDQPAPDPQTRT